MATLTEPRLHAIEVEPKKDAPSYLFLSTSFWQPASLKEWLSKGNNPNRTTENDKTLLISAAERNDRVATKLLLDHGADPDRVDAFGMTALDYATERDHRELAIDLIKHHADPTHQNKRESTPLHFAAAMGEITVLAEAVKRHADLNVCLTGGTTPLGRAILNGQLESVKFLLDHHANCGKQGYTAMHLAALTGALRGQWRVLMGQDTSSDPDYVRTSRPTVEARSPSIIHFLASRGLKVDARGPQNMTPLHIAAIGDNLDAAKALLALGADKKALDSQHASPADLASQSASPRVYQLLTGRKMVRHRPTGRLQGSGGFGRIRVD